jgi:Ca2+-binding RTX toxin-like protein
VPNVQDPTHRYEVSFVAAGSGALLIRPNTFTGATSASGQFTVQLFGEPPPAPPPVTPGPGPPCPDLAPAVLGGAVAHQACPPAEPPKCRGLEATIFPDPANPLPTPLFGTPQRDVIVGSADDDLIFARGGNDLICGLSGDDVLAGNAGVDLIYGGPGHDRLLGGDDRKRDDLFGEAGNDRHVGGPGGDLMDGGTGPDTFIGGPDRDVDDYRSLPGPVRVDLSERRGPGQDRIGGVEGVRGTNRNDRLFGDGGENIFHGLRGGDVIHGRGGIDLLSGEEGSDTLVDRSGDPDERGIMDGGLHPDRCLYEGRQYVFRCEVFSGDPLQPLQS